MVPDERARAMGAIPLESQRRRPTAPLGRSCRAGPLTHGMDLRFGTSALSAIGRFRRPLRLLDIEQAAGNHLIGGEHRLGAAQVAAIDPLG